MRSAGYLAGHKRRPACHIKTISPRYQPLPLTGHNAHDAKDYRWHAFYIIAIYMRLFYSLRQCHYYHAGHGARQGNTTAARSPASPKQVWLGEDISFIAPFATYAPSWSQEAHEPAHISSRRHFLWWMPEGWRYLSQSSSFISLIRAMLALQEEAAPAAKSSIFLLFAMIDAEAEK